MPMYRYECLKCDIIHDLLVKYESRNEIQECDQCGYPCERTWQDAAPMVMKAAHPDGTKRFDGIRAHSKLKQERQKAKARGDMETYEKAKKEIAKIKGKD